MKKVQAEVTEGTGVSEAVIEALAEAEETDPAELSPRLYDVIDPEALENLFTGDRTLGKVIFNYNRSTVSVFPDGYVSVETYRTQRPSRN